MSTDERTLYQNIEMLCQALEGEFDQIPEPRKEQLIAITNYISQKIRDKEPPKLIVICTHNSRRSHLGQLWLAIGADYYQLPKLETFSGGTEATAFNIRAVNAFQKLGLDIKAADETENPVYQITWKEGMDPYEAFSKKYDEKPNPNEKFAAIMVCSEADEGCPFVFGCDFRLSLPYDDPKEFDDTVLEAEKYEERIRQIGREILFALSQVSRT